ncbi:MAG: DNA polymerase III subunit chi [Gammaproteobacteria bacterium]|nr:DNA polymerase III subunit chi [Gammaproteobacteria bacterium]
MARVDFYVLQRADERWRRLFACRLAEKAYRLDHTVYLHTMTHADALQLDELLWTFRDGSFVPHALADDTDSTPAPVTIGCNADIGETRDVLINLCDEVPAFADKFARVAELVTSDDECRRLSRQRFVEYRGKGHSIQTHKL